jgi:hypothetical protein
MDDGGAAVVNHRYDGCGGYGDDGRGLPRRPMKTLVTIPGLASKVMSIVCAELADYS